MIHCVGHLPVLHDFNGYPQAGNGTKELQTVHRVAPVGSGCLFGMCINSLNSMPVLYIFLSFTSNTCSNTRHSAQNLWEQGLVILCPA